MFLIPLNAVSAFVPSSAEKTDEATLAPTWADRSRYILNHILLPRFGGTKLSGLRQEEVEGWYAERLGQVKAATANKELARLKHLLNRAVKWGYLKSNPAKEVAKAKEAPGRVRYLTPEEREALLREANPTLRLYILAALHTGARRGELLRLTWADVDMKARTVTFSHTKNGDARSVPMTDTLREALLALPRPLDPEALVFPEREPLVLTRSFARLVGRLGLPSLTFHDLRHDAASTLTMAGVPQRTIMNILGHHDPRMTMRYQHLAPGHLRDAMRALDHPPVSSEDGGAEPDSIGTIWAPAKNAKRRVWVNPAFFLVDDTGLEPVTSGM